MKTKYVCSCAAFVMATIPPLCSAQASFLDDIMGNNSGSIQSYTYTVTHSGQAQNNGAVQYTSPGARASALPPQRQPVAQQVVAPRVAYQQPMLQAQEIPQQRASSKPVTKKKTVNSVRSAKPQPVSGRRPGPTARSYEPSYPAQQRPTTQLSYGRTPQSDYYANPYQAQYTASPNYYQGYYNNWGSSAQACPPGRA